MRRKGRKKIHIPAEEISDIILGIQTKIPSTLKEYKRWIFFKKTIKKNYKIDLRPDIFKEFDKYGKKFVCSEQTITEKNGQQYTPSHTYKYIDEELFYKL